MAQRLAVLNEGRIQQVGTPREVYLSPKNRFVAEFVGEVNLFAGKVLAVSDGRIELSTPLGRCVSAYCVGKVQEGQEVLCCVRPEALAVARPGDTPRPEGGATSDHFLDVARLEFEPHFERAVGDAFSPVGLMVDLWDESLPAGQTRVIHVPVINDLDREWEGRVRLELLQSDRTLWEQTQPCRVESIGRQVVSFKVTIPQASGRYRLVAELLGYGDRPVRSVRSFRVAVP